MLIFQQQQEKPTNASPEGQGSQLRNGWCVIPAAGWICMHSTTCCCFGVGLSECAWHFSSSSTSPDSLISGHNGELAQSTCCLLQKQSRLKTHLRYNKLTSTCSDSRPPRAHCTYMQSMLFCACSACVCKAVWTHYVSKSGSSKL